MLHAISIVLPGAMRLRSRTTSKVHLHQADLVLSTKLCCGCAVLHSPEVGQQSGWDDLRDQPYRAEPRAHLCSVVFGATQNERVRGLDVCKVAPVGLRGSEIVMMLPATLTRSLPLLTAVTDDQIDKE